MHQYLFVFALLAAPVVGQDISHCTLEHARYTSMQDAHWTAGFHKTGHLSGWQSDVAFYIHSVDSGKTYWWLFDSGSAHRINAISTFDVTAPDWKPPESDEVGAKRPLGDMLYMQSFNGYSFSLDVPMSGTKPPTRILLPDLPDVLWYVTPAMERERAPLAFFKLTGCA